jgi:hypothetical protein
MTWEQVAALSAAQVSVLNDLATFGQQYQSAPAGTAGSLVPPRGYSVTKQAEAGMKDLRDLVSITQAGVNAARAYYRKQAIDAFEAANP